MREMLKKLTAFSSAASFFLVGSLSANMFSKLDISSLSLSIKLDCKLLRSWIEALLSTSSLKRLT
jgi:hypothetical protein